MAIAVGMLAAADVGINAVYALMLRVVTDAVVGGSASSGFAAAAVLAVLLALWPLEWRTRGTLGTTLHERTTHLIERRLLDRSLTLPGLVQHERPEYLDRLMTLRSHARDIGNYDALLALVASVLRVTVTMAIMLTIDVRLLVLLLCVVPSVVLGASAERRVVEAEAATASGQRLRVRLFDLLTTPGPAKELRIFRLGEELAERHRRLWVERSKFIDRVQLQCVTRTVLGWLVYTMGLAACLVIIVGRRGTSAGDALLFVVLAQGLNQQIALALQQVGSLDRALSLASTFLAVDADAEEALRRTLGSTVVPPTRIAHGIQVEHISFRYPGADADVFTDLSLALPAATTIAIVGDNGAGKTTLVKLLARFYEPSGGRITVDGADMSTFDPARWRAGLSGCFQDFAHFEFLARESVGVGRLERIEQREAVRAALVSAGGADLEGELPNGLETQLGRVWDGGIDLSVGQWQKVALGRAFMRSPLLLILDEPTASLDAETEHQLFQRYASFAKDQHSAGGITLLVSHRFTTVQMADLIVVLDRGHVLETGSHNELLGMDGLYAELFSIQARGYRR
jgi:ATP-binding cassette subfamily B protein